MAKFCSIIITHYGMNEERSNLLKLSLKSLFENTNYPYELIVVDNGPLLEDSKYLLDLTHAGKINTYIRNENNMSFGYARTQALNVCNGDYICIADNDIEYKEGWLQECIDVLDRHNGDIYSTPFDYPTPVMRDRYNMGKLHSDGKEYKLSMRAGSNCFVARRKDMEKLGGFVPHRIAGSLWTDKAVKKGYLAAVLPGQKAVDLGLHRGYELREFPPIAITLSNGAFVYFNIDEFKKSNPNLRYIKQNPFGKGN